MSGTVQPKPQTMDLWSPEAYQKSGACFPKMAAKVIEWLDVQPDDRILDIGCGDGLLDAQFACILARGSGSVHGIDSSPAMVSAARARTSHMNNCTFEVIDAASILDSAAHLQHGPFTKVFSNAALHRIVRPVSEPMNGIGGREFFGAVRDVLRPGGKFVFEMGGFGNFGEMRAVIMSIVARRVEMQRIKEIDPFFFPDESWVRHVLEVEDGGWEVEKLEKEWRPTPVDAGGLEGWIRLLGKCYLDEVRDPDEREACVREAVEVAKHICAVPDGRDTIGYVRIRCQARKLY